MRFQPRNLAFSPQLKDIVYFIVTGSSDRKSLLLGK